MTATREPTAAVPRGITTSYHGTRFRSRLEARWAAFFDLIDWSWVYEPFDTGEWIPDFLIRGPFPFLVEVGPCIDRPEYITKGNKARAAYPTTRRLEGDPSEPGDQAWIETPERWTLVGGVTPVYDDPRWHATAAGAWAVDGMGDTDGWGWWYRCDECGRLGLNSPDYGGYLRPCGHAIPIRPVPGAPLFDLWATAGNRVRWRPR